MTKKPVKKKKGNSNARNTGKKSGEDSNKQSKASEEKSQAKEKSNPPVSEATTETEVSTPAKTELLIPAGLKTPTEETKSDEADPILGETEKYIHLDEKQKELKPPEPNESPEETPPPEEKEKVQKYIPPECKHCGSRDQRVYGVSKIKKRTYIRRYLRCRRCNRQDVIEEKIDKDL